MMFFCVLSILDRDMVAQVLAQLAGSNKSAIARTKVSCGQLIEIALFSKLTRSHSWTGCRLSDSFQQRYPTLVEPYVLAK